MATFTIDLGFNWKIVTEQGIRHLQENFCMERPLSSLASYFRVISAGDELNFNIYDITCDLADPTCVDPKRTLSPGGEIVFRSADGLGPSNPFGHKSPQILVPPGASSGQQSSLSFNGRYAHWATIGPYTVQDRGRFIFTATLIVQEAGAPPRIFRVDPEMEIGPG